MGKKGMLSLKRRFDGEQFNFTTHSDSKNEAKNRARYWRQRGKKARVIYDTVFHRWCVYVK